MFPWLTTRTAPAEPECTFVGSEPLNYGSEDTYCEYNCGGKKYSIVVSGGYGDESQCPKNPKKDTLNPN
jgi:hypothetical protein